MFTGRAAFAGETISDTIAKLLEREPDWQALSASIPVKVRDLLRRCLEKPQPRRLHDIADARVEIEDALTAQRKPRRVIELPVAVTVVVLVLTLMVGAWWYTEKPTPSAPHEPVSILIADFQNNTSDPTFDRTLEPMLKIALEGAGFISAYDRSRLRPTFGVLPPERLDEVAARELAVKQGLGVVLSGSIERRGSGYEISVKAVQTVTGNLIGDAQSLASSKDHVLEVVTKLVTNVRKVLGDETSESAQLFAMRSVSASSLDVVGYYAAAVEAQANAKWEDARESYLKAVELDPKCGLGYQGLAVMSRNLGRVEDADKYIKEALRYLDGMTERERFGTRGFYFRMIGDNQRCAKEYGESLAKYPADTVAHNRRAVCLAKLRNMREAMGEMRQAVQMLPHHSGYRTNLALMADLAGDFQAAEGEVKKIQSPDYRAFLALAYSQVGRGLLREAAEAYQKMSTMGPQGASSAASGLGDLAVYEGRFADAVRVFEQGAAADLASKSPDRAAIKFNSTAYAYLSAGQKTPAVATTEKALLTSKAMPVRFLAARIFVETGEIDRARTLAATLSSELPAEPQAHGKIIEGQIALKIGNARDAIKILTEANNLLDTWFGHFELGRAYLGAGAFPEADSEFERCIARRGEALSLMDEGPTYGHFPVVYYYQGRVREGLKTAGFAESYRTYLNIRGKAGEDPLLSEVRRRVDH